MSKLKLRPGYSRVAVAAGAVATASAGFLLFAGPASAHSAPITGTAVCASNGTYTVTYTVHVSTVDHLQIPWTFALYSTAPAGSSVQSFNPNGFADSTLTLVQVNVPEVQSDALVTGEVTWSDGIPSGEQMGRVPLTGSCPSGTVAPPPPTSSSAAPTSASTTASAPSSVTSTSTAPTSASTTATAPSSASSTATAPSSVSSTPPVGSSSVAIAPPPPSTSVVRTTAPVSSFNNAPPPPSTHSVEATSATNSTSAVAIDVPTAPSSSPSDVNSPALASTGPAVPIGRTLAFAGLLASLGALLLVLTRRRKLS